MGAVSALVPHTPPAPLRPLVSTAVGYRVPAYPTGVHRGLPSHHLTLVVELLAPLTVTGLDRPVSAHGVVGGLHTRPALIDATGPQRRQRSDGASSRPERVRRRPLPLLDPVSPEHV